MKIQKSSGRVHVPAHHKDGTFTPTGVPLAAPLPVSAINRFLIVHYRRAEKAAVMLCSQAEQNLF
jgi:hypothetical protein